MLILWTILVTTATAHKVYESTEDIGPEAFLNVTTLYPISSKNNTDNDVTKDTNITEKDTETTTKDANTTTADTKETNNIESDSKDEATKNDKNKLDATVWKIEAAFAESNHDKFENNSTNEVIEKKNDTKEFRPSQHLGTFYDDEVFHVTPTKASFASFKPLKKPSSFVSSIPDAHFTKLPKQILQNHKLFPYKFETPILTRSKDPWRGKVPDSFESKPTIEAPVRVPAGSLYKYQDPFHEKPGDEDFGLEFNDGKDSDGLVKKRVNPWERFLQMVTAFLPVGLIISALTPSIITIENTASSPNLNTYPSNIYRRTDPDILEPPSLTGPLDLAEPPNLAGPPNLAEPPILAGPPYLAGPSNLAGPPNLAEPASLAGPSGILSQTNLMKEFPRISERCRRRLLCELHSDSNYNMQQTTERRRSRQCHKIRCDDKEALAKTLTWLIQYRQYNGHN